MTHRRGVPDAVPGVGEVATYQADTPNTGKATAYLKRKNPGDCL